MSRTTRSRVITVAVAAGVVVAAGATGAVAGSMVTSQDIKNYTIKSQDMGPNSVTSRIVADGAIIRRDLADNAVNGSKLADNAVGMSQLTGDVRSNLNNPSLSSVSNTYPLDKTVNDVGGPIAGNDGSGQGVTDIMHIRLKAGTYLLTYHGLFHNTTSQPLTSPTYPLLVAWSDLNGDDHYQYKSEGWSTDFGAAVPDNGGRETTAGASTVITLDKPTTVTLSAFGYQADNGGASSGKIATFGDEIHAIKIG